MSWPPGVTMVTVTHKIGTGTQAAIGQVRITPGSRQRVTGGVSVLRSSWLEEIAPDGSFAVDVAAVDDPLIAAEKPAYFIEELTSGGESYWIAPLVAQAPTVDVEVCRVATPAAGTVTYAQGPPGPMPSLSAGTATTLAPGAPVAFTITGTDAAPVLNLSIPKGDKGDTGDTGADSTVPGPAGPANELTIGTVTTLATGAPATATITGDAPDQVLNFGLPRGEQGEAGAGAPDATSTTKGSVQLAGDLAGTAAAPTVPGLASKAPLASPTFTGTVTSTGNVALDRGASEAQFTLNTDAGVRNIIALRTAGSNRWLVRTDNVAEAGSNAGADLEVVAYNDAGSFLSNPLKIGRASGTATFAQSPVIPTPTAGDSTTKAASTAFVTSALTAKVDKGATLIDVRDYGVVADAKIVETGTSGNTATASSTTVTASGFNAGDVGKSITIRGAGTAGAPHVSTITGYTSATQVTIADAAVTTIGTTDVVWGTDDAAALQAALDAAAAAGASSWVRLAPTLSLIKTGLNLSATVPLQLVCPPTGGLVAGAVMGAMITKPVGGDGVGSLWSGLNLDGALMAERLLDVLQCGGIRIEGGLWQDATVACLEFGRTYPTGRAYNVHWSKTRINGCAAKTNRQPALMTADGYRATYLTDSHFEFVHLVNCVTGGTDDGSANVHVHEHAWGFPVEGIGSGRDFAPTLGWLSTGDNVWSECYADTVKQGIKLTSRGQVRGYRYGAQQDWTYAGTVVPIEITASDVTVVGGIYGAWKGASGGMWTGHLVTIAPGAQRVAVIGISTYGQAGRWLGPHTGGGAPAFMTGVHYDGKYAGDISPSVGAQVYTASGTHTYTVPLGAKTVCGTLIGGGGGGGSGMSGAAGGVRGGGGGGGGGGMTSFRLPASALGASVTVTIALASGAGGASTTSGNGNSGTSGAEVSFGNFARAVGGTGGGGGTATGATGGASAVGTVAGGAGASASATGGAGTNVFNVVGTVGGPSGGGITAGDVAGNGGNGRAAATVRASTSPAGGIADGATPVAAEAGTAGVPMMGGSGGAGAASTSGAAQAGQAGAIYGGGGAGGGAAVAGSASGAGGAGGAAIAVIWSE